MKSVYYCVSRNGLKSRFVENLKLCGIDFREERSNINVYKHSLQNINNYIFSIDQLDNNALQFIEENKNKYKIFIDSTNDEAYLNNADAVDGVTYLSNMDMSIKNNINVSRFINYSLFNKNNISINKKNILAIFLNNTIEIPYNLLRNIEKNNIDYRIRLFDNSNIKHIYNIGLISESDKAEILKTYKYFISLNNNYFYEAIICGIKILNMKNLTELNTDHSDIDSCISINNFIDGYLI